MKILSKKVDTDSDLKVSFVVYENVESVLVNVISLYQKSAT